ncbi:hypothetical protein SmJEL517_g00306 [Synchytrium microbalum]|uniref:Very long-chain fatty acid transport protein n=1 Tax=Synchytrium microbalum TaxID=1806994 RepID=A0A507CJD3_9FUNG|nr:uncharacterized protein SmJEL517_g00306 [Synchytrium microbalum]TPX38314.1 hypothetical protein SmJEL517_g00306 [Synchytrium microbalum]
MASLLRSIITAPYDVLKEVDNRLGLSHDIGLVLKFGKIQQKMDQAKTEGRATYIDFFMKSVADNPNKEALVCEGRSYTYSELNRDSNRVANYLINLGVKPNDMVPVFFENSPEFILVFLGLMKCGAAGALINNSLTGRSLAHCVNVANGSVFIFSSDLSGAVKEVIPELNNSPRLVSFGNTRVEFATCFGDTEMGMSSPEDVDPKIYEAPGADGAACLIYTSGTTGLPKGAIYKHSRLVGASFIFYNAFNMNANDRFYTAQPLYHSAALVICFSTCMMNGLTCIVAKKFSASRFFDDCKRYNATIFQYIGELCRYLLNTPADATKDRNHNIRLCVGNGLRPDNRFGIAQIGEFYAATEGVGGLFNFSVDASTLGAVGRMGPILRSLTRTKIVKFDIEKEIPVRGPDGRCIEVKVDEAGEMITEIDPAKNREFAGYYRNAEGTSKKLLTNVFKEGDQWYRSGDLLKYDSHGKFYFVDRIGDTFRWKGENVSTNEVAELINLYPGIEEANVYGVAIPGKDGRAGMGALVTNSKFKLEGFGKFVASKLPKYAVPLFIRMLPQMQITQTFKHQKVALRSEGIDLGKVTDALYMFDEKNKVYVPFGAEEYKQVIDIRAKFKTDTPVFLKKEYGT